LAHSFGTSGHFQYFMRHPLNFERDVSIATTQYESVFHVIFFSFQQIQFLGASVLCILGEIGGIITLNIIQIQVSYSFPSFFLLFVQTFLLVARLIFLLFS
jgi:hypothetical protein